MKKIGVCLLSRPLSNQRLFLFSSLGRCGLRGPWRGRGKGGGNKLNPLLFGLGKTDRDKLVSRPSLISFSLGISFQTHRADLLPVLNKYSCVKKYLVAYASAQNTKGFSQRLLVYANTSVDLRFRS